MEPDDEDGLEGEVPGEVVQDYTEREALSEVEEPEDDPICEPLDIILVSGGLKALNERNAGRAQPTRLDTGPARELTKWKRVRKTTPPRTR